MKLKMIRLKIDRGCNKAAEVDLMDKIGLNFMIKNYDVKCYRNTVDSNFIEHRFMMDVRDIVDIIRNNHKIILVDNLMFEIVVAFKGMIEISLERRDYKIINI